jgi:hypothetical protein
MGILDFLKVSPKPKYEELAQFVEKEAEGLFGGVETRRRDFATIFSTYEGHQAFFTGWFPALKLMAMGIVSDIAESRQSDEANLHIARYGDLIDRVQFSIVAEALNDGILRTRKLMLDLIDASSTQNEKKIAELRDELKSRTLSPEQKEVVDSILDGFKKSGGMGLPKV